MKTLSAKHEYYLQPGEYRFAKGDVILKTLLGSCIAITMWHPDKKVGGMCHFMLPYANGGQKKLLDGRYANEAIALFLQSIRQLKTSPEEYEVKVFGGGQMFSETGFFTGRMNVSQKNIESAYHLLNQHGFSIKATHVGDRGHRKIIFDIRSGHVWMLHIRQHHATGEPVV